MPLPRWLRGLTRPARPSAPRPTARSRPRLEPLEDRSVPAAFPVTTLADAVPGSLRQAILDANAAPGDDAIPFEVTGNIDLAGPLPALSTNIDLQGPGADLLTVRRNTGGFYVIFRVAAGATVNISCLTVTNGSGGISNSGTLTLNNATVSGNSASGAGTAGGITNFAVGSFNATVLLLNSTIANNTVSSSVRTASQIYSGRTGTGTGQATVQLRSTLVAGTGVRPTLFADSGGTFVSQGHNLSSDSGSGFLTGPGDLSDTNPLLGPLQDNGGPTLTHALLPGSPALDSGDNADAPDTDQRGLPRVVAGTIDIGSFEVQVGPVASFFLWPFVATVPADVVVDLYVVALDAYGHLVTNYTGTAYLVSTDPAVAPVAYTFRPEDGGVAYLEDAVTFRTPSPQLLLAIDATFTAIGFGLYEVT